ncbi:MAG: tetratricopeptide repeat protein [Acidisphaera sp.]|nr:tetratricopeptide repeat protein [Acidisphaera sp.]
MNARAAWLGAAAVFATVAAVGVGVLWTSAPGDAGARAAEQAPPDGNLPIPPVPPRIAEGERYEHCLSMLDEDAPGASAEAEAWQGNGGGEAAAHCMALARIAMGEPVIGAQMLESLARQSEAPQAARAMVFGQAAQAREMANDIAHAFDDATQAVALSPDDPDLLLDRAIAAGALGKYQDSIDDLDHALEIDPHRLDAMVLRGSAWRHLDHLELAADDIDRVLLADPDNAEALLERGILRQRGGDMAGAQADWERAMKLAPDSATADLAQQDLALLEAGPERR